MILQSEPEYTVSIEGRSGRGGSGKAGDRSSEAKIIKSKTYNGAVDNKKPEAL